MDTLRIDRDEKLTSEYKTAHTELPSIWISGFNIARNVTVDANPECPTMSCVGLGMVPCPWLRY